MAAEAAYNSWGPRYAPPDPTLPKPWTALIDGTTGFMYYWNLETNITQYEKPTAVLPVVPSVSALMFSTPEQKRLPLQGNYTPQLHQGVLQPHQSLQYTGYQQCPSNIIQKPPIRYGGSQFGQLQQKSVDCNQYGPKFQKQMSNVSPVGLKTVFKDSPPLNAKNGELALVPHQPKFPTPMPKNHGKINSGNPTVVASPDAMTHKSVGIYPKKDGITSPGDKVPAPFMSFESTGFPPEILKEISADFASPTPIQAQTWPIALQNRDIVAITKTDSGKTLGYLIPAFMLLRRSNNSRQHGPTVVVLSPTRELALQIQDEAIKFGRPVKISCSCLYGEAPKGPQLKDLERGADIVVATPGRLNDVIEKRKVDFGQVSLLVLDEADRMLDMGFETQIRKIVNVIPPRKQTLMYTATWPKEVRKIASDLLVNPVQVNIDSADELAANKSVTQDCKHAPNLIKVDGDNKFVPHNVRDISSTYGGGFGGRGGRFGGSCGVGFGGRKRNDRLKDFCGRGQFDNRRDGDRSRGRSHSRSRSRTPVRRGRSRSQSCSYSRSRSPSPRWGRSRTRTRTRTPVRRERRSRSSSRSWRRSYSRSRSWSRSRSRSRSRSWTPVRRERWGKSK